MLFVATLAAPVFACAPTTIDEIAAVQAPAIVVLGERHGHKKDLKRAAKIARALSDVAPVTVALEAVFETKQGVVDRLQRGEIRPRQVEAEADWANTRGHRFAAYRPLLGLDVGFVAAGPPLKAEVGDREVPVPEAYNDKLQAVAIAHGMSPESVSAFSEKMALRDLRIAELALDGWDEQGILVVVAGRGHVAEGLGITWQLDQGLSSVPWSRAPLGPSDDCGDGDRYLP